MRTTVQVTQSDTTSGSKPKDFTIARGFGWLSGERVVAILVGLPVSILVARHLGPENLGILGYSQALVGIFMPLAAGGLSGIVVRDLVQERGRDETLGSACALQALGSLLVTFLAIGAVLTTRPGEVVVQVVVGIAALRNLLAASQVIDYWLQSRMEFRRAAASRLVVTIVIAASKVAMVSLQVSVVGFALLTLLESLLIGVVYLGIYRKSGKRIGNWRVSFDRCKELLAESWPLTLCGVATMVQAYIDQVMLGEMLGDSSVGQYSVAIRLIGFAALFPVALQKAWAPKIASAKKDGHETYLSTLSQLYKAMFGIFLVQGIPIFLFASPLVSFLYGESYSEAGILLSLLSIRLFFANFGLARAVYVTNESLFRHSLLTAIAGATTNVVANYVLIPDYGAVGAIVATIGSFLVTVFVIDALFQQTRVNFFLMIRAPFEVVIDACRFVASRLAY